MSQRRDSADRLITAEDLAFWRAAMRDTIPLSSPRPEAEPTREAAEPEAAAPPAAQATAPAAAPRRRPAPPPRRLDPSRPVDIDRRTWRRLRRGRLPIEGRIDLHGLTQDEAHRALSAFLARMRSSGARCVLVITGRGLRTGGVLRQMVPQWLEAPGLRDMVLAFGPARIEHGGEGALYVLLRRRTASATGD